MRNKMCRTYGAVIWCLFRCYKATEPTALRKKLSKNENNENKAGVKVRRTDTIIANQHISY